MKLSYIIPVYNVEKYLRQCVDSVLAQTMDDYEIILVDDGSPDNCPAICDEYKEKYPDIVKIIHKKNEGPSVARNCGIKEANGKYLFFIDSDDYLVGDNVEKVLKKAVDCEADIVHLPYYVSKNDSSEFSKTSLETDEGIYSHKDMNVLIQNGFTNGMIPYMWRNLYKREFLIKNNIFLDENLKMIEDPPFNVMAFGLCEKFMALNMPVYCYRIRTDSLQRRKYVADYDKWLSYQWQLKMTYYKKYYDVYQNFYEDLATYTVKAMLPMLLHNIYANNIKRRYSILKRIGNSEMMRRSFKDYDINNFRSKSLDWWVTWCVKYKLYFPAHIICEKILYK